MSQNKYLRYGECIILQSKENPYYYLAARSILEEDLYFIQTNLSSSINLNFYNNFSELIFCIYPKLSYQAEKQYAKLLLFEKDTRRLEILKNRVLNEQYQNEKTIQRYQGQPITIGSEILLYHFYSSTYVRASQEKYSQKSDLSLLNLKLSSQLDSGLIFKVKIDPYFSFKKNGDKICYDDSFYLENIKMKTQIEYRRAPKANFCNNNSLLSPQTNLTENKKFFSSQQKQQPVFNKEEDMILNYSEILERSQGFEKYRAEHIAIQAINQGIGNNNKLQGNSNQKNLENNSILLQNYYQNNIDSVAEQKFQLQQSNFELDISTFRALSFINPEAMQEESRILFYGQYVRIKHIIKGIKQQGYLSCQINVAGWFPQIHICIQKGIQNYEQDPISSIFQIITFDPNFIGQPIKVNKQGQVEQSIILRHFLTGRYLVIPNNPQNQLLLFENFSQYLQSNKKLIQSLQEEQDQQKQNQGIVNQQIKESISIKQQSQQIQKQSTGISENQQLQLQKADSQQQIQKINTDQIDSNQTNSQIKQFKQQISLQLITPTIEDEFLTTNNNFSISNCNNQSNTYLQVDDQGEDPQKITEQKKYKGFLSDDFFIPIFRNMNTLNSTYYMLNGSKQGDQFFFNIVNKQDIQDIMSVNSKLNTLIYISENPQIILQQNNEIVINECIHNLEKLCQWMCDCLDLSIDKINKNPLPRRQTILRDFGTIDMCFKILYTMHQAQLFNIQMSQINNFLYKLSVIIISFLRLVNIQHYNNSIYTFQWYYVVKKIVTQNQIPVEIQMDILLNELFQQTLINVTFESEINNICNILQFDQYNNQALNLLIGFCSYNPFRQKDNFEEIVQTVFTQNYTNLFNWFIFQYEQKDKNFGVLQIIQQLKQQDQQSQQLINFNQNQQINNNQTIIEINDLLEKTKPEQFKYLLGLIKLSTEISKGDPGYVKIQLQKVCTDETCIKSFTSKDIHSLFRAYFLDLFVSSYLSNDFRYFENLKYPHYIFIKPGLNQQNLLQKFYNNLIQQYVNQKETSQYKFNIKNFIFDFINEKIEQDILLFEEKDHKLLYSILKLANFLLHKGFFEEQEIFQYQIQLNSLLDNFLSYSINKQQDNDDEIASRNNIKSLSEKKIQFSQKVSQKFNQKSNKDQSLQNKKKKTFNLIQNHDKNTNIIDLSLNWIIEILISLTFIQKYTQQQKLHTYFQDKKQLQIFEKSYIQNLNEKQLKNAEFIKNTVKKIQQEKQAKVLDYLKQYNNIDQIQIQQYLLLLNLNNNMITQYIVNLIYTIYTQNYVILNMFNHLLLINEGNIDLYSKLLNIYQKIYQIRMDFYNISSDSYNQGQSIYENIDNNLFQIMDLIFIDYSNLMEWQMQNNLKQVQIDEGHQSIKQYNTNNSQNQQNDDQKNESLNLINQSKNKNQQIQQSIYQKKEEDQINKSGKQNKKGQVIWNIMDGFSFDVKQAFKLQDMLRHLNFHELIMNTIRLIAQSIGTRYKQDKELFQKENIIEKCIVFLIFFTIKNLQNQQALSECENFNQFIKDLLSMKFKQLQTYILLFIKELYKDNYYLLVNSQLQDILDMIFVKYSFNYQNKYYDQCIYFLNLLNVFYIVKDSTLTQNQILLIKLISYKYDTKTSFFQCLQFINNCKIEQNIIQKLKYIQVPQQMVLACIYLNSMRSLVSLADGTNKKIFTDSKHILSLLQIKQLLKSQEQWWIIKLEVILYFNKVYLSNKKLEEGEQQDIQYIIQDILLQQIKQYNEYQKNYPNNQTQIDDYKFYSEIQNSFFCVTSYSSQNNIIDIEYMEAYKNYIYIGILQTLEIYSQRFLLDIYNQTDQTYLQQYIDILQQLDCKIKTILPLGLEFQSNDSPIQSNNNQQNKIKIFQKTKNSTQQKDLQKLQHLIQLIIQNQSLKQSNSKLFMSTTIKNAEQLWNKLKEHQNYIIEESIINIELNQQIQNFIELLVKTKQDNEQQFKKIIQNCINLLADSHISKDLKLKTLKILRCLTNYKSNDNIASQSSSIHQDLCQMGFSTFLCKLISEETSQDFKSEYINCLIDFLDEGDIDIQESLFNYMQNDINNTFLLCLHNLILTSFQEIKEYEKRNNINSQININQQQGRKLQTIILSKIQCCKSAILVLKLACEGHYKKMQNYLRHQIIKEKKINNSINIIQFTAQLFCEYIKFYNTQNIELGENIIDFLIEVIQGPCHENQLCLVETKLLECMEDLMYEIFSQCKDQINVQNIIYSTFTKRIYVFLLSLFEGNKDEYILNKIGQYINPEFLIARLDFIYQKVIKPSKKEQEKQIKNLYKNFTYLISFTNDKLQNQDNIDNNDDIIQNIEGIDDFYASMIAMQGEAEQEQNNQLKKIYHQKLEDLQEEGNTIYILMKQLSSMLPQVKEQMKKVKIQIHQSQEKNIKLQIKTLLYYKNNISRIEIINEQNEIQLLYFAKPNLCKYLSSRTKEYFLDTVNRDSANDKINGLLDQQQVFIDEMLHFQFLRKNIPINLDFWYILFRKLVITLAFVINMLILFDDYDECEECADKSNEDLKDNPCVCSESTSSKLENPILILSIIELSFNIATFLLWFIIQFKLDIKKANRQFDHYYFLKNRQSKESIKAYKNQYSLDQNKKLYTDFNTKGYIIYIGYILQYMTFNSYFIYLVLMTIFTILGLQISRIFYCFLMLDIIDRSIVLRNVIKSITVNYKQLLMTAILGVIVIYIYGMIGYYIPLVHNTLSPQQLNVPLCVDAFSCFLFTLNLGLRSGGGVGDIINQPQYFEKESYTARFFYDFTFFIFIIIILLNIIFGIIIDTFAELRDEKTLKDQDQKNKCFICSIERTIFEKEGIFFDHHIQKEHSAWNFLYYTVYLRKKDEIDYNGTETYVCNKLKLGDISWLPIGKSLSLEHFESNIEDEKFHDILKSINSNLIQLIDETKAQQNDNKQF